MQIKEARSVGAQSDGRRDMTLHPLGVLSTSEHAIAVIKVYTVVCPLQPHTATCYRHQITINKMLVRLNFRKYFSSQLTIISKFRLGLNI